MREVVALRVQIWLVIPNFSGVNQLETHALMPIVAEVRDHRRSVWRSFEGSDGLRSCCGQISRVTSRRVFKDVKLTCQLFSQLLNINSMALNLYISELLLQISRQVERFLQAVDAQFVAHLLLWREASIGKGSDKRRVLTRRHIHMKILIIFDGFFLAVR